MKQGREHRSHRRLPRYDRFQDDPQRRKAGPVSDVPGPRCLAAPSQQNLPVLLATSHFPRLPIRFHQRRRDRGYALMDVARRPASG